MIVIIFFLWRKNSTPSTDSWMTKCAKEAVARFSSNSSCRFQINHHCNRTSKILLHPLLNFLPSQKHKLDISQWPQWLGDLWQWWNMMKSSFIMNDPSISINFFTVLSFANMGGVIPTIRRRQNVPGAHNHSRTFYHQHLSCKLSTWTFPQSHSDFMC